MPRRQQPAEDTPLTVIAVGVIIILVAYLGGFDGAGQILNAIAKGTSNVAGDAGPAIVTIAAIVIYALLAVGCIWLLWHLIAWLMPRVEQYSANYRALPQAGKVRVVRISFYTLAALALIASIVLALRAWLFTSLEVDWPGVAAASLLSAAFQYAGTYVKRKAQPATPTTSPQGGTAANQRPAPPQLPLQPATPGEQSPTTQSSGTPTVRISPDQPGPLLVYSVPEPTVEFPSLAPVPVLPLTEPAAAPWTVDPQPYQAGGEYQFGGIEPGYQDYDPEQVPPQPGGWRRWRNDRQRRAVMAAAAQRQHHKGDRHHQRHRHGSGKPKPHLHSR